MLETMTRLRAKRTALAAELARIDGLIEKHDALMRAIEEVVSDTLAVAERDNVDAAITHEDGTVQIIQAKSHSPRSRGPNGSSPEEIVRAAKRALLENEKPMTRYQLVEAVEDAGLVVGGVDKGRNMGTILWRSKQFTNTGDGYWPASEDAPVPADYHEPSDEFDL